MLRSERSVPPRLVIAGGGPAGSIAAAYLRRILRRAGWSVTLVAPEPAAGPSVALATRPAFTRFRQGFDIDEAIFLRRCAGTYRLASRFEDWFAGGRGHWHPFGACGPRIAGRDLFHYWLKLRESGARREAGDYADYAPQTLMAAEGRGPRPQAGTSSLVQSGDYGYHLDRAGLVRVFREIALSEGVRAVPGRVRGIERDPYGDVAALLLDGGERIEGDVFLDCTGAAAQLVGTALGEPWIAEGGAGDRIAYLSTAREPEPAPFTLYRGRPEGWVAALPLAGRSDHALVYDGRTTPPETAQALLRAASGCENGDGGVCDAELRRGRRRAPWQRNVVAVGAAAGAVEPLMGFGLDLVLAALEAFVAYLPRGGRAAEVLRRAYVARMNRLHDDAEQAVAAHYVLGRRPEPFWAAARAAAVPERLADRLDLYELAGHVEPEADAVFGEGDHYLLFAGADFLPRRPFAPVDVGDGREIERLLAGVRARSAQVAQTMAPHADLLEGLHGRAPAGPTVQVAAAAAKDSAARHGPQSLRQSPEGARLADLVAGLGQPFGYERSVKATPAGLQTERFLVSLHRTSLGLDPAKTLDALAEVLGLPAPERSEAAGLIAGADLLHLGYEAGPSGALYKLYVEWSARADAAWHETDAAGAAGAEPILVHRAYKWRVEGSAPPVVTLYHWPRVRTPGEIEARLARLGETWEGAGASLLGTARDILRLAREHGRGAVHYLEAREEPGPRLSYDLNLYACGLTMGEAEMVIGQAIVDLGVPPPDAAAVLAERRGEALGHVAGGVGRDGIPFLTVYSGMAEA
ncbi:tryptophan 7-halogenase [Methylorubrum thiocyanatum]|uniref:tryptophan 7-halogenase n=1 Tax=Methylorubrum thiocyanatum TaxID=47958 RepID=UPI00383BED63